MEEMVWPLPLLLLLSVRSRQIDGGGCHRYLSVVTEVIEATEMATVKWRR